MYFNDQLRYCFSGILSCTKYMDNQFEQTVAVEVECFFLIFNVTQVYLRRKISIYWLWKVKQRQGN